MTKHIARLAWTAAALPLVFLGGCAGGSQAPPFTMPTSENSAMAAAPFQHVAAPDAAKNGIYVSSFEGTSIYGFRSNYKHGHGPMCTVYTGQVFINFIAADGIGNLIVPQNNGDWVKVYQGPSMCGPQLGEFKDPYGQPAAAASFNAATGTIAVVDIVARRGRLVGNLAICTLDGGCTKKLTNPNITGYALGVALAKNGDCWLASENSTFTVAAMTYWKGCTGSGQAVSGFKNSWYGSLSIDKQGNLVSVDVHGGAGGQLWVYSGCSPACTVVGGPFALRGNPLEGALNAKGNTFGTIETALPGGGTVDIYKYTPTKLTYEYSFNSSFALVSQPAGFAYTPALKQ